jgi:cytochrome P450
MTELAVRAADLPALMGLFAPAQVADPYQAYREWRVQQPIARPHERLFVLSRFADCEAVFADTSFGHARPGDAKLFGGWTGEANIGSFLGMNPPDHTRLRRLVSRVHSRQGQGTDAPHRDDHRRAPGGHRQRGGPSTSWSGSPCPCRCG